MRIQNGQLINCETYYHFLDVITICLMIRCMHQDWMIHQQERLRGALEIHFRYMDHAHTKSAMSTFTGVDSMVGCLRKWQSMVITPSLLHFITTLTFLMMFGMDSIFVMVLQSVQCRRRKMFLSISFWGLSKLVSVCSFDLF